MFLVSLLSYTMHQELLLFKQRKSLFSGYLIARLSTTSSKMPPKRKERSMKTSSQPFPFCKTWTITSAPSWQTRSKKRSSQLVSRSSNKVIKEISSTYSWTETLTRLLMHLAMKLWWSTSQVTTLESLRCWGMSPVQQMYSRKVNASASASIVRASSAFLDPLIRFSRGTWLVTWTLSRNLDEIVIRYFKDSSCLCPP